MKRFFFIWVFLPFISCCQTNNEFKLHNSIPIEWGKNCIGEIDCFYLSLDSTLVFDDDDIFDYYYTLYYSYSNKNRQVVVTGDLDDLLYGSTLNSFRCEKANSYIVLLKNDHEYSPTFKVYYLNNGKLLIIGDWGINAPSPRKKTPDYLDYSVANIRIYQKNDEIVFSFLKDVQFKVLKENYNYDDWGSFKAGELIVSFNIIDSSLKRIGK
jgi:hypothetical protein